MSEKIKALRDELDALCARIGRRVQIMEVCGTHTVSIFRTGIRALLPANLRLVSGPGCPVCVTAQRHIDAALQIAARDEVILATYGDMMRVPGRDGSLEKLRAGGARIRVINSAATALDLARQNPDRHVVFLAVGFETTAPATAATVLAADRDDLDNFSVLMCHKLVIPAMLALLAAGDVPLDAFLCPGHVSVIIGSQAYQPIVERHGRACVVAGFEPEQILSGLVHLVRQLAENRAVVENVYPAVVSAAGNCDGSKSSSVRIRIIPAVDAATSFRARSSPTLVRSLPVNALRSRRSDPVWSAPRAPVPPGTSTTAQRTQTRRAPLLKE